MRRCARRGALLRLAATLAIAAQPDIDQMLAAANGLDKKWNEDHDAFTSVYESGDACDTRVPVSAKRAWASHDLAIAGWGSYYDALGRRYDAENSRWEAELARLDAESARLRKLRSEENLELIRVKQRAHRDANPLHQQIIAIRMKSLSYLDKALERLEATKRTNANLRERTEGLTAYLAHARKTLEQQDTGWDNFYRGQLLSLRAHARVHCPEVFDRHYKAIEPTR